MHEPHQALKKIVTGWGHFSKTMQSKSADNIMYADCILQISSCLVLSISTTPS